MYERYVRIIFHYKRSLCSYQIGIIRDRKKRERKRECIRFRRMGDHEEVRSLVVEEEMRVVESKEWYLVSYAPHGVPTTDHLKLRKVRLSIAPESIPDVEDEAKEKGATGTSVCTCETEREKT